MSSSTGLPLMGGLFLGGLLALFFFPSEDPLSLCQQDQSSPPVDSSAHWVVRQESMKPVPANDPQMKKVVRARFAATELGIRERLLVLVWAEGGALALALNSSLARHIPSVVAVADAARLNVEEGSLPNLISFRANGFHAHTHILNAIFNQTLHENYDWFLFLKEATYANPFALLRLINKVSWKDKVAIGWGEEETGKCNLDAGILLSNPAMQMLIQQRHACNSILAANEQSAFETCIQLATNLSCKSTLDNEKYAWWRMSGGEAVHDVVERLSSMEAFNESLTVSPLLSEADARALHDHFVVVEMQRIERELSSLQDELQVMRDDLPDGPSWPPAVPSYSKPPNRYQVPVWEFFTANDIFKNEPNQNVRSLKSAEKEDIFDVLAVARRQVDNEVSATGDMLQFVQLRNGYRMFDARRGMEYMLDLVYRRAQTSEVIERRVHVSRSIEHTTLMQQVPYVKEDSDLTVVVPVAMESEVLPARRLLARQARLCGSEREESRHTRIVIVIVSSSVDSQSATFIANDLEELKRRCKRQALETSSLRVAGKAPLLPAISALDEAVDRFGPHSMFLLLSPHSDIQKELLDRARINTIKHYQIFMPIPFVEFHPTISGMDRPEGEADNGPEARQGSLSRLRDAAAPQRRKTLIVHKDHGRFDSLDFSVMCLYGTEYLAVRSHLDDNVKRIDLADAFLSLPNIHLLRAIEPALRIRFHSRSCDSDLSEDALVRCTRSKKEGVASKEQLSRLLFHHE